MTEAEWSAQRRHPQAMVNELRRIGKVTRTKAGKRKLRLFGCGCCRLVWDLLADPRLRRAVEVAERFAEGNGRKDELRTSFNSILELTLGGYAPGDPGIQARTAAHMALSATTDSALACTFDVTAMPLPLAGYTEAGASGDEILCNLLRCVFGNPFRAVSTDASWRSSTVVALAQGMYAERAFDRMPILADALEETGCTDAEILGHCRGPGPHVRGCWVVDLILGKS